MTSHVASCFITCLLFFVFLQKYLPLNNLNLWIKRACMHLNLGKKKLTKKYSDVFATLGFIINQAETGYFIVRFQFPMYLHNIIKNILLLRVYFMSEATELSLAIRNFFSLYYPQSTIHYDTFKALSFKSSFFYFCQNNLLSADLLISIQISRQAFRISQNQSGEGGRQVIAVCL